MHPWRDRQTVRRLCHALAHPPKTRKPRRLIAEVRVHHPVAKFARPAEWLRLLDSNQRPGGYGAHEVCHWRVRRSLESWGISRKTQRLSRDGSGSGTPKIDAKSFLPRSVSNESNVRRAYIGSRRHRCIRSAHVRPLAGLNRHSSQTPPSVRAIRLHPKHRPIVATIVTASRSAVDPACARRRCRRRPERWFRRARAIASATRRSSVFEAAGDPMGAARLQTTRRRRRPWCHSCRGHFVPRTPSAENNSSLETGLTSIAGQRSVPPFRGPRFAGHRNPRRARHGVDVVHDLRDRVRVRGLDGGGHVELASQRACEASKKQHVVIDEYDAGAARSGSRKRLRHPWRYATRTPGSSPIGMWTASGRPAPISSAPALKTVDLPKPGAMGVRNDHSIDDVASGQVTERDEHRGAGAGLEDRDLRSIHGSTADVWSIDDLIEEFERLQGTIVTVKEYDGTMSTLTELELRLSYERVL